MRILQRDQTCRSRQVGLEILRHTTAAEVNPAGFKRDLQLGLTGRGVEQAYSVDDLTAAPDDIDAAAVGADARLAHEVLLAIGATVGLLLVVFSLVRTARMSAMPYVVGVYIGGAYFFTSSTSFANPAVTVARTLSDTFAGIEPSSAPMFVLMQVVGVGVAVALARMLFPRETVPVGA